MLAAERQTHIIQTLNEHGSVRTTELAERLNVTDETIRRDLEQLHAEGILRRTHGGAVPVPVEREELPHDARQVRNHEEKEAIARTAVSLIRPNDVVYFDASSTCYELARLLVDMPLKVLTNSHLIVAQLRRHEAIELICIGGDYDRKSHSFVGPAAQRAAQRYRIDKMFCSGNGIDANLGVSEINEWQATIKELVIGHAQQVIYLADHTKIGSVSAYSFASCESVSKLVTNATADAEKLADIGQRGVEVLLAQPHAKAIAS
ncbi:MAG: DeoR/GlpR family DNA-binding transcription regulator [Puniceicoccales bacterium]